MIGIAKPVIQIFSFYPCFDFFSFLHFHPEWSSPFLNSFSKHKSQKMPAEASAGIFHYYKLETKSTEPDIIRITYAALRKVF